MNVKSSFNPAVIPYFCKGTLSGNDGNFPDNPVWRDPADGQNKLLQKSVFSIFLPSGKSYIAEILLRPLFFCGKRGMLIGKKISKIIF